MFRASKEKIEKGLNFQNVMLDNVKRDMIDLDIEQKQQTRKMERYLKYL